MTNKFRLLASVSLIAALTACGGGGSGGDTTSSGGAAGSTPATPIMVVASTGSLQTSAPAATYAANSLGASAFSALNAARLAAGAGVLSQNAAIDVAAAAHALYLTSNGTMVHDEDPAKVDFYAASPADRVAKAGASNYYGEDIGGTGASRLGSDCVVGLLDTVYHGAGLLNAQTSVGMGFGTDGAGVPLCVFDYAVESSNLYGQVPASGSVIAYPYNSQTGVWETFWAGYESPRPPVSLFPNLTAGTPVLVSVRNADYLNYKAQGALSATVLAFTLKDAAGNVVPSAILAHAALTAGTGVTLNADSHLPEGFAVLVPFAPLAKGATYTASFSFALKAGDAPVTKTWSFTTNS